MKKQYILIALALIGVGIATTLAFSFDDTQNIQSEAYLIGDDAADANITKVRAFPYGGSLDKVRIKLTIESSAAFDVTVDTGVDLTGCDVTTAGAVGTVDTTELSDGHFEITGVTGGITSLVIKIDGEGDGPWTDYLWEDIESLIIGLADA